MLEANGIMRGRFVAALLVGWLGNHRERSRRRAFEACRPILALGCTAVACGIALGASPARAQTCPENMYFEDELGECAYEPIIRIADKVTSCDNPSPSVFVECPADYQVVGGGIDFRVVCPKHDFAKGYSSYARGNGWYCRADQGLPDCYAVCAHRDAVDLGDIRSEEVFIGGGGNTRPKEEVETIDCDTGYGAIAVGLESESLWGDPKKSEEYKTLGHYVSTGRMGPVAIPPELMFPAGTAVCQDRSPDHWGYCHALCAPEGGEVGFRTTGLRWANGVPNDSACEDGEQVIGGGIVFCRSGNCSGIKIDAVEAFPILDENRYVCDVNFLGDGNARTATECQATCLDVSNYKPVAEIELLGIEGATVSLSAAGSRDPDGRLGAPIFDTLGYDTLIKYIWSFGEGGATPGPLGIFMTNPSVSYSTPGEKTVLLTVFDDERAATTTSVTFTIDP